MVAKAQVHEAKHLLSLSSQNHSRLETIIKKLYAFQAILSTTKETQQSLSPWVY